LRKQELVQRTNKLALRETIVYIIDYHFPTQLCVIFSSELEFG